ncbi:S9 family peptidase, partial [Pseudoxanthomonas sp. SGD-10]
MRFKSSLKLYLTIVIIGIAQHTIAQFNGVQWSADGYSFYEISTDGIIEVNALDERKKRIFIPAADLTPKNQKPLKIARFTLSDDKGKVLLHTNTQKVWRYDTRGDYWVFDIKKRTLS